MITAVPQRRNARKYVSPETKSTNDPPPDEAARLVALYQCNILDTPPEKEFDEIAHLAALICGTPIALISFIDSNRQWFKSSYPKTSIRHDVALCAYTIRQKDILIVPDILTDQRFAKNPLSLDNMNFYAGIPLITSDHQAVGTLCVIDRVSRQLNSLQTDALRTLGCQVVKLLELRRATKVKSTHQQQFERSRHFFTRIVAGFGLASAILLGSGLVWQGSLTDSVARNDWQQHYQVLEDLKDIQSTIQKGSIANHYATRGQANYIEPLDNINRKIDLKIHILKQKSINNPYLYRRLSSLEPLINRIQDGQTPNKSVSLRQMSQLVLEQKAIAQEIEVIEGEVEKTQMLVRSQTQLANTHSSIFTFSAGFCLCFLILTGVYYFTDQSIGDRQHTQAAKKQQITDPVLDTVGALIVVLDSHGKIIQINRFCEQITGYTRASVKGKYFWELFSIPSEAEIAKSNLSNLLDTQTSNEYENFILTKDGDRRHIAWSNTTRRSATGEVEYAILSGIDITPHLTASLVLASSEQHWRAINSLFTFVAVLTPSGILIEANQALLAAAKLQPKDVLGLPLTQTYWWSYSTEVQTQMQTAIERVSQGECVRYDVKGRVGENQLITIDFALTPMFDAAGKISYLIASGVDVTEHRQLETKRQQANEQLKDRLKELKQRNREITLLGKMNDVLQACLTVKEAYSSLAQLVQPLFPNLSGGIFIDQNKLVSVASWGSPVLADLKTFTPRDCWALRQGKPHIVDDTDNGLLCKHLHHTMPAQSLCVPIIAQSTSAGVLYLFSLEKGSITPAKQQLAYTVAEHIGLALANLKRRETLEHKSVRDPLTELFNRRYMEESLLREMHRCDRKQQPLSLMMIDVDHFKRFNDTFGHDAGDTVLRELGKLLQTSVRACDIACRYGGEEFTLILPEASLNITLERAEQIRDSVKQLVIDYCGQSLGTLTLSIGIACYPDCGHSGEAVLKAADRALYQAKQQGRDRAIAATQS